MSLLMFVRDVRRKLRLEKRDDCLELTPESAAAESPRSAPRRRLMIKREMAMNCVLEESINAIKWLEEHTHIIEIGDDVVIAPDGLRTGRM